MAIEDSNPERRNLVVLSMAIIAFYVGGCEIPATGEIELPLIKLKFTDAYHLAWLIWITLFWFAFRYWMENKFYLLDGFFLELNQEKYFSRWFSGYFFKKLDSKKSSRLNPESFKFTYWRSEDYKKEGKIGLFQVRFDSMGELASRHDPVQEDVKIGIIAFLIYPLLAMRIIPVKRTLSAYLIPILIFIVAVGFGVSSFFQKSSDNYYIDVQKFLTQMNIAESCDIDTKLENYRDGIAVREMGIFNTD